MKKESPDIIYLQCGNEDPEYGVTWSPDLINKDDIEYRKSKQITIEEAIERVLELNNKNRYVSPQNVNGQRAGYIQALKDFNLLKQ